MFIVPTDIILARSNISNRRVLEQNITRTSFKVKGSFKLNANVEDKDIFKLTIYNNSKAYDKWGNLVKTQNILIPSKFCKPYESSGISFISWENDIGCH